MESLQSFADVFGIKELAGQSPGSSPSGKVRAFDTHLLQDGDTCASAEALVRLLRNRTASP